MNFDLQMHGDNVYKLSIQVGKRMNINGEMLRNLALGALLHDIGKKYIPKNILDKNTSLTDFEMQTVKQHVLLGAQYLIDTGYNNQVVEAALYHHERYDGKGYCYGLKENEIPLLARIISVTDSFDAMISERPYKKPLTINQAIKELNVNSGSQFDPDVVTVFLGVIKNKYLKARVI